MIANSELRRMVILGFLRDGMLEKLVPIIERVHYDEQEYIFRQGDMAEKFYMLNRGKVLLEQSISEKMTVSIESIRTGYSIGWSSLLTGGVEPYSRYTSNAICTEPSELFVVKSDELNNLMDEDREMGYLIGQRLIRVIARRLRHRTEQFLRIIRQHPDINNLIID